MPHKHPTYDHGTVKEIVDHALAAAGVDALVQRGQHRGDQMNAGAGIADLRTGGGRRPLLEPGGAHRPTHRLRDDLVGLEVRVPTRTEPLDRGIDEPLVQLVQTLPREAEAVHDAGAEILHQESTGCPHRADPAVGPW